MFRLFAHWGATRTTTVAYVIPVVGIVLGFLVLSEPIDARIILGTILVAGIALVNSRFGRRRVWGRMPAPSAEASDRPRIGTARRSVGYPRRTPQARASGGPPCPAPPIILVPGFWLGAWAWDEVADLLRADGHDVTALTLPGLESTDADRSAITLRGPRRRDRRRRSRRRTRRSSSPSTAPPGSRGYAASDRVPERIAAMVYVDTAPGQARRSTRTSRTSRSRWSGTRSRRRRTSTA